MNTPDLAILFWAMDRWIGTGLVSLRCGEKADGGLTEIFRVVGQFEIHTLCRCQSRGQDRFVKGTIAVSRRA